MVTSGSYFVPSSVHTFVPATESKKRCAMDFGSTSSSFAPRPLPIWRAIQKSSFASYSGSQMREYTMAISRLP